MIMEIIELNLFMIWSDDAVERLTTALADFVTRSPHYR